jgi:hypothetical protein
MKIDQKVIANEDCDIRVFMLILPTFATPLETRRMDQAAFPESIVKMMLLARPFARWRPAAFC